MRWSLKAKPEQTKVHALKEALNVDDSIAELLIQRGIETFDSAKEFFRPSWEQLHDPFLMKGMDHAVSRVLKAITEGENIMVYGDYDVDGTTSVALMSSYLKTKTEQVVSYIPDRYDEGYGISYKGINFAADNDITLIVALDCGIKAIEKVAYAKEKGVDFIICDHHRPGDVVPDAIAVLDPKQSDCDYPFKELCGCGVGFKLIQAIASKEGLPAEVLSPYLDLVATAIGADIVPVVGENRALAYLGLQIINSNPRPGFKAFIDNFDLKKMTMTDVVFKIAPRINAAGRMKHGLYAVNLLTQANYNEAVELAAEIEAFNLDRRETDASITEEALELISENNETDNFTTVLYKPHWHKGVIGIVASRLIETYYRPTLVFTKSGDMLAASARSVKGFDVYNALEACSEHIEQFGGHKYAAGLTLKPENYDAFKTAFENQVKLTINERLLTPEVNVDLKIDLEDITPKFWRIIKQFAPFGPQNLSPVFMTENLVDTGKGKRVGQDQSHLRICVKQHTEPEFVGIGFGLGDKESIIKSRLPFSAVYAVDENNWQGNVSLQLKLKDIKS